MKLPKLSKIKWNYLALAFFFPCVGMLINMLIRGSEPFGSVTMLYSDMYHQYYPFFVAFRKAILSGESLLYTWSIGMGMDYLGLISYYLASPLNLLSVLVPEGWLLEFYCLLMPIKLGLAGLFFAIFLKKLFHKNDLSIALFGTFYAYCAWALGYQWNIMWLDTFALLPLVALGTVSLLRDKKFVLYTVTLFLSVFSNYYIGFFTCIFVLLLFICYQICRWQGFRKFVCDLIRIAFFSILAIGMTAILELPALAALQTTQSSVNSFPTGFRLNIASENTWKGLLDAMRQVAGNMNGGLETSFKEGLPNLYCGVGTIIFSFLFLTCRQVKFRDKLCCVLLLLFFAVSFIIRQLDYIWHGFHFPNMIPYRFSFLYSFVMLYMAYRAYLLRHTLRLWQVVASGILAIGIMLCANDLTDPVYLAYNGVFLLLYLSTLIYSRHRRKPADPEDPEAKEAWLQLQKYRRSLSGTILAGIMAIELVMAMVNFSVCFPSTSVSNYPLGTTYSASMLRYMQEREEDTLFYRTEVTHSQTLNDGALNGYNGISTFTSSANVRVTEFMQALGYGAKNTYNRYCFEESSPVANLFLNLKYMLERSGQVEENAYFDDVHHFGEVHLLENNAYLPLGFLADSQLINVDFDASSNSFSFQNKLLQAASGITGDVWQMLTGQQLSITGTDVTINSKTGSGYCAYTTAEDSGGTLIYTYTANKEGLVCIDLDLSKRNSFSVWKNGVELYSETYSLPQMVSVCNVVRGDTIEIHLTCKSNENGTVRINCGILNETRFREAYELLAASTLELTDFENTYVAGTINCQKDGVLYTSIPQDGNWSAIVDGEPAQIVLIGEAMVGLLLSEGYHEISFTYHNAAFSLGWKISLGCLVLLAALYLICYKPKRKKGKYEK